MVEFHSSTLLTLLALLLCSVATWRSIVYHRKSEVRKKLLQEKNETLAALQIKLNGLEEKEKKYDGFQETLNLAEITTKLQEPRLSAQNFNRTMSPPERYRYVHSLASGGMSPQEIASVLSISIHEADQLVNLARLAHL